MTSEEFWKDDPQLFVSYRISFINKEKREKERLDYKCWLQGAYIHSSSKGLISKLMQFIHNMFAKIPDNSKIEEYPIKPFTELEKDEQNKEKIEQNNCKKQNETLICQASMKKAFLEKVRRQKRKG